MPGLSGRKQGPGECAGAAAPLSVISPPRIDDPHPLSPVPCRGPLRLLLPVALVGAVAMAAASVLIRQSKKKTRL